MTLEEIEFELEMIGMPSDKLRKLLSAIKRDGFDAKALDRKLMTMGYAPVFDIYDEEENDKKSDQ